MGVSDGQAVDAANTNPAFLDANADDTALGKINLNNVADPTESGNQITNIQRELNGNANWLGMPPNTSRTRLPTWVYNDVGSPVDNMRVRVDALTERFNDTTGHDHTGSPGEGPLLTGASMSGVPLKGVFNQGVDLIGVTGTSLDVSTELTGKLPSTADTVKGVVVNTPYNKVILRDTNNERFEDGLGNEVFGRLTEAAGVWTLSFLVDTGSEVAYDFTSSTDIKWYYQELYEKLIDEPVYDTGAFLPSDNATADILYATTTVAGKIFLPTSTVPKVDFDNETNTLGVSDRPALEDHTHSAVLDNDQYLKARNFGNSANVDILKLDTADDWIITGANLQIGKATQAWWGTVGYNVQAPQGGAYDHIGFVSLDHATDSSNQGIAIGIDTGTKPGAGSLGFTGSLWLHTGANEGTDSGAESGYFSIDTGSTVGGASGNMDIFTGYNTGTNVTGYLALQSGNSSGTSGNSGLMRIKSGDVSATTGDSGVVAVVSGNSTNGNSGNVLLQVGSAGGTHGDFIFIKAGFAAPTAGDVWTCSAGSGAGYWAAPAVSFTPQRETFTLIAGDITNGYVDLANVALANSIQVFFQGLLGDETVDYTVNLTGGAGGNTRIDFSTYDPVLAAGDKLIIYYGS